MVMISNNKDLSISSLMDLFSLRMLNNSSIVFSEILFFSNSSIHRLIFSAGNLVDISISLPSSDFIITLVIALSFIVLPHIPALIL